MGTRHRGWFARLNSSRPGISQDRVDLNVKMVESRTRVDHDDHEMAAAHMVERPAKILGELRRSSCAFPLLRPKWVCVARRQKANWDVGVTRLIEGRRGEVTLFDGATEFNSCEEPLAVGL